MNRLLRSLRSLRGCLRVALVAHLLPRFIPLRPLPTLRPSNDPLSESCVRLSHINGRLHSVGAVPQGPSSPTSHINGRPGRYRPDIEHAILNILATLSSITDNLTDHAPASIA